MASPNNSSASKYTSVAQAYVPQASTSRRGSSSTSSPLASNSQSFGARGEGRVRRSAFEISRQDRLRQHINPSLLISFDSSYTPFSTLLSMIPPTASNQKNLLSASLKAKDWEAADRFVSPTARNLAVTLHNSLSLLVATLPPETPNTLTLASQLVALARTLLAVQETRPFDLGSTLNQHGKFLMRKGLTQDAVFYLDEAIQIQRLVFDGSPVQNHALYLCKYHFNHACALYETGNYDLVRESIKQFLNTKRRFDWSDRHARNEVGDLWNEEIRVIQSWGIPMENSNDTRRRQVTRVPSTPSTLRSKSSFGSSTMVSSTFSADDSNLEWYDPPPGL